MMQPPPMGGGPGPAPGPGNVGPPGKQAIQYELVIDDFILSLLIVEILAYIQEFRLIMERISCII